MYVVKVVKIIKKSKYWICLSWAINRAAKRLLYNSSAQLISNNDV